MVAYRLYYFHLNNGVSAVFEEQALPYLKRKDQEVLQIASCVDDTGSYLKELSPEIKDCLSAIGGAESADLLGVESVSFSMPFLDFSLPCCKQQAFCYTNVPSVSTAVGAPGLECNKKISALSFSSPLLLLIFVSN
jgi:hypothetical protein